MAELVRGSSLIRSEAAGARGHRAGEVDPGPLFASAACRNSSARCSTAWRLRRVRSRSRPIARTTIPLIDPDSGEIFHTGNFLAQYTGVAMDQLRYHLGLLAKHVDVQIALLMTPEFSYGLSASLVGNTGELGSMSASSRCRSAAMR